MSFYSLIKTHADPNALRSQYEIIPVFLQLVRFKLNLTYTPSLDMDDEQQLMHIQPLTNATGNQIIAHPILVTRFISSKYPRLVSR